MGRGVSISDEVRAAAITALAQGTSAYRVAKDLGLSESTVGTIKKSMAGGDLATIPTEQRDEIGELIARSIRSKFAALQAIEAQFTDKTWLQKQNANDVARAHTDIEESLVRILTACEQSGGQPAASDVDGAAGAAGRAADTVP